MQLFPHNALIGFSIEPTEFDDRSECGSFQCNVTFSTAQGIGECNARVNGLWIFLSAFDLFVSNVRRLLAADPVQAELSDLSEWFSIRLSMTDQEYSLSIKFSNRDDRFATTHLTTQATLNRETVERLYDRLLEFPRRK